MKKQSTDLLDLSKESPNPVRSMILQDHRIFLHLGRSGHHDFNSDDILNSESRSAVRPNSSLGAGLAQVAQIIRCFTIRAQHSSPTVSLIHSPAPAKEGLKTNFEKPMKVKQEFEKKEE